MKPPNHERQGNSLEISKVYEDPTAHMQDRALAAFEVKANVRK